MYGHDGDESICMVRWMFVIKGKRDLESYKEEIKEHKKSLTQWKWISI